MKPRDIRSQSQKKKEQFKKIKGKLELPDEKEIEVSFWIPKESDILTISVVPSPGKGFAGWNPYGAEIDHVNVMVKALKSIKVIRQLIVPHYPLNAANWDSYLVESEIRRNRDPDSINWEISDVNKIKILSDSEVIELFISLESQYRYKVENQSDDKPSKLEYRNKLDEMVFDDAQIVDLLIEMFKKPTKEAGEKYIQEIRPIWEQLKENDEDNTVRIVEWYQVLNEMIATNEIGETYNIVDDEVTKLKKLYNTNNEFKKGIDEENSYILKHKKYREAGERLVSIIKNPQYENIFTAKRPLKKFTDAICTKDFNKLGEISTRDRYRFVELVQMMYAKTRKEVIFYRGSLRSQALRKFFHEQDIPLREMRHTGTDRARLRQLQSSVGKKYEAAVLGRSQRFSPLPLRCDSGESKQLIEASNQVIVVKDKLGKESEREYKKDQSHDLSPSSSVLSSTARQVQLLKTPNHKDQKKSVSLLGKPPSSSASAVSDKSSLGRHQLPSLRVPGVVFPPAITPKTQATLHKFKIHLLDTLRQITEMELVGLGMFVEEMLQQHIRTTQAFLEDKSQLEKLCTQPTLQNKRAF